MPQIVSSVVTDAWRTKVAQAAVGAAAVATAHLFVFGCGGWQDDGMGGKEPVPPSKSLTTVTAGTGVYDHYTFTKHFVSTDLVFLTPTTFEVTCFVTVSESNDDGHGVNPDFYELGIFDAAGTMMVYSTFPKETKDSQTTLRHVIHVDLA